MAGDESVMVEPVANLIGVLLAGALLGVVVWVADVGILAWLVSRPVLNCAVIAWALGAVAATAVLYVAIVTSVGLVLSGH
jgi:hypothetical protein